MLESCFVLERLSYFGQTIMKRFFKDYTSFTRAERIGLAALSALLALLIGVRVTMHYWVKPKINREEEQRLVKAWEVYKRSQPKEGNDPDTVITTTDDYQDAYDDNEAPLPNIININTADSATLVRLKGIGPVTASRIVAYRKQKGPFTAVEQLLEVSSIPKATFKTIKGHLSVDPSVK